MGGLLEYFIKDIEQSQAHIGLVAIYKNFYFGIVKIYTINKDRKKYFFIIL